MAVVSLKAMERTPGRKGAVRKLRREGRVPAVLYGPEESPRALSLDGKDVETLFKKYGASSIILELEIEGENGGNKRALVKEVQRDTVTGKVLHMDLQHVSATRKVTVEVPVVLTGEAKGVKEGGVLEVVLRELEVQCLPDDIPDKLELSVEQMGIGDSIHVRDVSLPGVEILNDPDSVILTLVPPTVYEEVKVEAAPEEEVVAEEKEEAAEEKEEEKEKEEKEKEKE